MPKLQSCSHESSRPLFRFSFSLSIANSLVPYSQKQLSININ
uniref:Uncharacterized protein n=1 Tax=Rhizophora mucronata TaxID=61149 RepID=A0A2P2N8F8_RHIMU